MTDVPHAAKPEELIHESQVERAKVELAIEKAQRAIAEHARQVRAEREAATARSERARRRPGYASPP